MRRCAQLVALSLVLAIPLAAAPPKKGKAKAKPSPVKEEPAQPPRPIAPMSPELLPATPPQVSFLNGQLTIQSENSTLADILAAVRARTGAQIEAPPGANERVFGRFGPGTAQQVITQLLTGSRFDFIVLGSPSVAGGIQKVILTARRGGNEAGGTPAPAQVANSQPAAQEYDPDADDDTDLPERADEEPPPPPPVETQPPAPAQGGIGLPNQPGQQPNVPGQPIGQPIVPPTVGQPANPQQQQQGQEGPQVKTPEQLLQELQRLQQQQQQQQQNQNSTNPR